MAWPANACTTEAKAKDALGISGTADDGPLHAVAAAAARRIEEYIGPVIERDALTLYPRRGLDDSEVWVPELHRPGTAATVEERTGTSWTALTVDTEYIAWPARGSTNEGWLSGRITRVDSSAHPAPWPTGLRPCRVTWTPGRFGTPEEVADDVDGASIAEAFVMTVKHLWQPYTTQLASQDEDYATLRPVWPGFALPNAAEELLMEHAEKAARVPGYDR